MKSFKTYILGFAALAAAAVGLSACQDDIDAPVLDVPKSDLTPTMSIMELKEMFWNDATNYAKKIEDPNDPERRFIIHGRVITSDEAGNVFKSIVIQDETAALAFSVDTYNLYLKYRIGQDVVLDLTGMDIGKYAGLMQIGRKDYYEAQHTDQVSFMSPEYFEEHLQLNGNPEPQEVDTIEVNSFSELTQTPEGLRYWQSRVVRFKKVHFEEGGKRPFSYYHTKEKSEMETQLIDQTGQNITVRTSGYCDFYNNTLPVGTIDLVAYLGYFNSAWQLLVMDAEGVMPANEKGSKEKPYTVEEAIDLQKAGVSADAWVKGYIVGTAAPEVDNITDNSGITWQPPFVLDNTLVIAPSKETADYSQCIVVVLPSGSLFQRVGNLADNEGLLGHEILVKGNFAKFLGTYGLTGNSGNADSFEIEGVDISGQDGPAATINASQLDITGTANIDGYDITISKAAGYTPPAFHDGSQAVRLYADNTITFKGQTMKTITFTLAPDASFKYCDVKCSTGEISPAQAIGDTQFTWVGSASEVTFTVGALANLATTERDRGGKGQLRFTKVEINGGNGGGGDTPVEPGTPTYTKATSLVDGNGYVLVASGKYSALFSKNYGYMATADIVGGTADSFEAPANAALTFTAVGGGYNISTSESKYLGAKPDFNTFDTTSESSQNRVWTVTVNADGTATITNLATGKTIYQDPEFGSFGCYATADVKDTYVLPTLYTLGKGTEGGGDTPVDPNPPTPPSGEGITIDASAFTIDGQNGTATDGGYTLSVAKNNGTSNPALKEYNGETTLRIYAKGSLTISGPEIAKIVFTINDATNAKRYAEFTPSTGKFEPAQAVGDKTATWVGNASEVTFTVADLGTLGTEADRPGQIHIRTIQIIPAK